MAHLRLALLRQERDLAVIIHLLRRSRFANKEQHDDRWVDQASSNRFIAGNHRQRHCNHAAPLLPCTFAGDRAERTKHMVAVTDVTPLVVDVRGACRLVSLSKREIYRLLSAGQIRGLKVGRKRLFLVDSLRAHIERLAELSA